jgi:TPR repeat protein
MRMDWEAHEIRRRQLHGTKEHPMQEMQLGWRFLAEMYEDGKKVGRECRQALKWHKWATE